MGGRRISEGVQGHLSRGLFTPLPFTGVGREGRLSGAIFKAARFHHLLSSFLASSVTLLLRSVQMVLTEGSPRWRDEGREKKGYSRLLSFLLTFF